jgi:hypothetical protein
MKMATWLAATCDKCFITVYPAVFTTIRYKRSILSNTTLQYYTTTCLHASVHQNRHRAPLLQQFQQHKQIQINHQPDATIFQFIILTFIYSSVCFGRFPAQHQERSDCSGSLWFYLRIVVIVVLCSWSGTTITTIRRLNQRLPLQSLSS